MWINESWTKARYYWGDELNGSPVWFGVLTELKIQSNEYSINHADVLGKLSTQIRKK